jgi:hypothetical protein
MKKKDPQIQHDESGQLSRAQTSRSRARLECGVESVGWTDQLVNRRVATQFSWRGRSFCIERTLSMDIMDTIEGIDIDIR